MLCMIKMDPKIKTRNFIVLITLIFILLSTQNFMADAQSISYDGHYKFIAKKRSRNNQKTICNNLVPPMELATVNCQYQYDEITALANVYYVYIGLLLNTLMFDDGTPLTWGSQHITNSGTYNSVLLYNGGYSDGTGKQYAICNNDNNYNYSKCSIPTTSPTRSPTDIPTSTPTDTPTKYPSQYPSKYPSEFPSQYPSKFPSEYPSKFPTLNPSYTPTKLPSKYPTLSPTNNPTLSPSDNPSKSPTKSPTNNPTNNPSLSPTKYPTFSPSFNPSKTPTEPPTNNPTNHPSISPTK
eukprot:537349_1